MKRMALIISALCLGIAVASAGVVLHLKPTLLFTQSRAEAPTGHGVPSYADGASEEIQARRYAIRLVEQLGAVQDRIIRGDRTGLTAQKRLLDDIAREIRDFGPEQWNDYVNVRTSLLFVLSGGDANVLRTLVGQNILSAADDRLAKGIISFAEGRSKNARELFEGIDPRSLDVSLVGPFALARASLYFEDDRAKAVALLDDARLACPHTAIDEAAARREIPMLFEMGETDRAMTLTTSYVREFGRSIYAWRLFREIAEAVAKREELDDPTIVDRLAASIDDKAARPASELFADLAGEALLQGRLKLASAAAATAIKNKSISPEDLQRAQLYAAAADAPSSDAVNALKALDQIALDRLSGEDAEIREVAGFIANTVAGTQTAAETNSGATPGVAQAQIGAKQEAPRTKKTEAALGNADAILKEADTIISGSGK